MRVAVTSPVGGSTPRAGFGDAPMDGATRLPGRRPWAPVCTLEYATLEGMPGGVEASAIAQSGRDRTAGLFNPTHVGAA